MAINTKTLLVIAISFFLSTHPSHSTSPAPSPSTLPESLITLTPEASPPLPASLITLTPDASPPVPASLITLTPDASPALSPEASSSSSSSSSSSPSLEASYGSETPVSYGSVKSASTFEVPLKPLAASTADVTTFVKANMVGTMAKTDEFITNVIEKRLADPNTDIYAKDCLKTCKEVYEDAMDSMKRTTEEVKKGNYYKANVDVSAMSTDIDTCNDCIVEIYGDDHDFEKFQKWAQGVASDCLGKITGE